ncbi:IS66-like element accessory protein TnpA [Acidiphilium rubrum]|uniref:IS66-like element accessory protein TnpA n=1 Tax=Acidiphilium rubrum TaxID=526 RepID=UPI002D13B938|nr:transposase [Acidiphilium rubrum]HQT86900.1 transposase [Acidiphilium rubrum]
MEGEIVARVERRRMWSAAEKAALLAEVEAEGGRVSVVAKRHRISESLLYNWRSAWKAASEPGSLRLLPVGSAAFVQLGEIAAAQEDAPAAPSQLDARAPVNSRGAGLTLAERVGVIEIDLPDGVRVRLDGGVSEKALRRVLLAVREVR